jgi:hypothetical protein
VCPSRFIWISRPSTADIFEAIEEGKPPLDVAGLGLVPALVVELHRTGSNESFIKKIIAQGKRRDLVCAIVLLNRLREGGVGRQAWKTPERRAIRWALGEPCKTETQPPRSIEGRV